jgi:hypothetical protein
VKNGLSNCPAPQGFRIDVQEDGFLLAFEFEAAVLAGVAGLFAVHGGQSRVPDDGQTENIRGAIF